MSEESMENNIAFEQEEEIKWDYRRMTKKQRKRFLQKKEIIQDNYETFVKQIKNEVLLYFKC